MVLLTHFYVNEEKSGAGMTGSQWWQRKSALSAIPLEKNR